MALHPEASDAIRRRFLSRLPNRIDRVERQIRGMLGYTGPLEIFDHHQSHAASSFFYSGFDEAAVLTVDGVGEWATTTFGRAAGPSVELFEEVHFPSSLGLLYSALTSYLGFEVNDGEYKVMGLAPYGEPRYADQVRTLVTLDEAGQYRLNLEYFDFLRRDRMYSDRLVELFGEPPRRPESELLALSPGRRPEPPVGARGDPPRQGGLSPPPGPQPQPLHGGRRRPQLRRQQPDPARGPFDELFVQPAASDAGGCLGAAALAHVRLTGERPAQGRLTHMYWGPATPVDDIAGLLAGTSAAPPSTTGPDPTRCWRRRSTGWRRARSSAGSRAAWSSDHGRSGRGRSWPIRATRMRDRINALVKMREGFRPFAPAVLAEPRGGALRDRPPVSLHAGDLPGQLSLPTCRRSPTSTARPACRPSIRGEPALRRAPRALRRPHRLPDPAQHVLQHARRADRLYAGGRAALFRPLADRHPGPGGLHHRPRLHPAGMERAVAQLGRPEAPGSATRFTRCCSYRDRRGKRCPRRRTLS